MPLTPNDILQKRFGTAFRGAAPDEVYAFLRTIAEELETALREATTARSDLGRVEDQIEEFRHMETTLRNTLISTQKVSQEIRGEAEHRADLIVREAELEAERRLQEIDARRAALEQEIMRLMAQRRRFEAEFAALLDTHARLIRENHLGDQLRFPDPVTPQLPFEEPPAPAQSDEPRATADESPSAAEATDAKEESV